MSMHSIGQAWAHWKQVSHLSVPHSSYSSWSRPRNLCGTSRRTSGYLIVTFGSKNRRRVSAMPLTMPRPGIRLIEAASLDDHHDRRGRDEQVEQRGRQQPFPGEVHELVDPDPRQRSTHPHEGEHEDIG